MLDNFQCFRATLCGLSKLKRTSIKHFINSIVVHIKYAYNNVYISTVIPTSGITYEIVFRIGRETMNGYLSVALCMCYKRSTTNHTSLCWIHIEKALSNKSFSTHISICVMIFVRTQRYITLYLVANRVTWQMWLSFAIALDIICARTIWRYSVSKSWQHIFWTHNCHGSVFHEWGHAFKIIIGTSP